MKRTASDVTHRRVYRQGGYMHVNMELPKRIEQFMCRIGMHKFRVIEVKFSFGASGRVEKVECERCNFVMTRQVKKK